MRKVHSFNKRVSFKGESRQFCTTCIIQKEVTFDQRSAIGKLQKLQKIN